MSAQVTEAHRALALQIQLECAGEYDLDEPTTAQLIADSEAKATDQLRAERDSIKQEIEMVEHRAYRAEAEVERLCHLEAVLRSSAADMTAGSITAGGVADLRAENERLRRAYVRPDDIRAQLESAIARAKLAEAELAEQKYIKRSAVKRANELTEELATERARLDWLEDNAGDIQRYNSSRYIWSANQNLRAAIDAAMKEDGK